MDTDFLSPLALGVDPFALSNSGGSHSPLATQLINPNREAMLIDEFRFMHGIQAAPFDDTFALWVKLLMGGTPLTNDFIPLRAFAPTYFGYGQDNTFTWHLPRPLYVPPDVQVSATFKKVIPPGGTSPDVNELYGFSIMGRSMPAGMQIPDKMYVPWACATTCLNSEVVPFVSSDADLTNPFDEPLNLDYFTGFNYVPGQGFSRSPITVQMTLSNGKVLLRDPAPFNAVFPQNRPILRARALLQPKEFISTVLDLPQPTDNYENLIFTTVGMTGWREIPTPLGALP